jgi:hypothetical protein
MCNTITTLRHPDSTSTQEEIQSPSSVIQTRKTTTKRKGHWRWSTISETRYKLQQIIQTAHYRGNVITHTLGEDFEWDAAPLYYKNIDKLIDYINERKEEYNMEIIYSTPSKYLEVDTIYYITGPSTTTLILSQKR